MDVLMELCSSVMSSVIMFGYNTLCVLYIQV